MTFLTHINSNFRIECPDVKGTKMITIWQIMAKVSKITVLFFKFSGLSI